MYALLKQSGELLDRGGDDQSLWTIDGIRSSVDKLTAAYRLRREIGVQGLTLVSGAGNIIRGNALREQNIGGRYADVIGRMATMQNTLAIAAALEDRDVPIALFAAPGMLFSDPTLGSFLPYSDEGMIEAYSEERVVLIGGGTGEDGVTTDNAVMTYAQRMKQRLGPDEIVQVIKGTKYDGVFDSDPAKNPLARRYSTISAQYMLKYYERLGVVDEGSLRQIAESGIAMRVYRDDQHDLVNVLGNLHPAGTLIVSDDSADYVPQLAA
jgi:uridylate kinase